jgi:hypothetical protein
MIKKILYAGTILSVFASCQPQENMSEQEKSTQAETNTPQGILTVANQTLEVDAKNGGKVKALIIDGKNFLTGPEINADNWGSTFWTSPQSAWGWPPAKEINQNPYQVEYTDGLIKMTSEKDSIQGYIISKVISSNEADTSFTIVYSINNQSGKDSHVAPWEITRVEPGGITFYPTGEGDKSGLLAPLVKDINGITWFDYNAVTIPNDVPKLIADGTEGWLAQVNNGYILVKVFEDIPLEKNAPGEGEIEIYTNPDKSYIEIEQQGAYDLLKKDESVSWSVKWVLRKLPENIDTKTGSEPLAAYARKLASK